VNWALPGWAIDLIRDGVPADELKRHGSRAVWNALVRTAASAYQRGWCDVEWEGLLAEPASNLGRQAGTDSRQRLLGKAEQRKRLSAAWDKAVTWASGQPPAWTSEQAAAIARERAQRLTDIAADPDISMADSDRTVLAYAAKRATESGTTRICLPEKQVALDTGLPPVTVHRALKRLHHASLLVLVERGRRRDPNLPGRGRASAFELPGKAGVLPVPVNRQVLHPHQASTPPPSSVSTPPGQVSTPPPPIRRDAEVVTLTLSSTDPQALADAVAALSRMGAVEVVTQPDRDQAQLRLVREGDPS
jgi:hypothetical protein